MTNNKKKTQDYYVVDFLHIFKTLWKRVWVIILASLICGVLAFSVAKFIVTPMYSSSVMLYVNNSSFSLGSSNFSNSSSDLIAAQSLVKTYTVFLINRTTLGQVAEKSGYDYTYEELCHMIKAEPVDETEVLRVTVTADDPQIAADIANTIAEVLPQRIDTIMEGASMEVVDRGIVNPQKVSPYVTRWTIVGLLLGGALSVIVIALFALLDNTIHDDEYILKTYDYPILAKVPNLLGSSDKQYAYYYQRKKSIR